MIAKSKIVQNSKVIQTRQSDVIMFSDANISFIIGINQANRESTGDVIITFDKVVNSVGNFIYGPNRNRFIEYHNSKTIQKSTKINSDNNGPGNGRQDEAIQSYIYTQSNIESITITAGAGIQTLRLLATKDLPELKSMSISASIIPDFGFLKGLESLKILSMTIDVRSIYENQTYLNQSNIEVLIINSDRNMPTLLGDLPISLKCLSYTNASYVTWDIANFFNGNRIGFLFNSNKTTNVLSYNGGAIFSPVLEDIEGYTLTHILQLINLPASARLTPLMVSRFIVDFANQVTACNLTNKVVRLQNHSADTSYTDPTQPLFTTYASALNHITTTLGITVTFT